MKGMFVFIRLGERVQHTKVVQRSPPSPLTTTTTTATTATTTTTPVVFGEEFVFVSDGSEGEVLVIGVVSDDEQHFFGQVCFVFVLFFFCFCFLFFSFFLSFFPLH